MPYRVRGLPYMSEPIIVADGVANRPVRASAKLPTWYIAYCALAVFNVAVLSLSLWLNHREVRALDFSANSYSVYARVLDHVNAVGSAVFAMDAAGNGVFASGDVAREGQALATALAQFHVEYEQLTAAIERLSLESRATVATELAGVKAELAKTYADAHAMQESFILGDKDIAVRHMAAMNGHFSEVVQYLFAAARTIRREQFAIISVQKRQAELARGFAAGLAIVAVLLAIAAVMHGRRIYRDAKREAFKRKQQMRRLAKARDQAEQAVRAKARFLATMSHEIRTPMNGVLGMLDALSATPLSKAQAGILKTTNASADLLLSMIDDVLDFSLMDARMLSIKSEPVDLTELVQRTFALYATPAREKMLSLQLEAPEAPLYVLTDAARLTQVLCNFLGNALKFTAAGSVHLSLAVLEETDGAVRVRFSVRDTGIGIDADLQKKLFAPFTLGDSATNRRYGGTGLGLAICKQLAKLLDPESGDVGVESSPGAGATFYVVLRLQRTVQCAQGMGSDVPFRHSAKKFSGRVLIAEDNETNRQVLVAMLRNLGLQGVLATNGHEAISAVQRERYDLILMDYHMPELDGCLATMAIRRHEEDQGQPRTPIVAVTASVLAEDREACLAAGMDDFAAKPLRQKVLAALLEKWLPPDARRDANAAADSSGSFDEGFEDTWTTLPEELFDRAQLLEMRGIAGESFEDLIRQFHGSVSDGLSAIRNAIENGDAVALKRAAHKLKGAAATLGAKTVAERCHALDIIGKEQRMEAAAEQLHCLEQEYLEVRRYMEACTQRKAACAAKC